VRRCAAALLALALCGFTSCGAQWTDCDASAALKFKDAQVCALTRDRLCIGEAWIYARCSYT
jgi:hypothetical protein